MMNFQIFPNHKNQKLNLRFRYNIPNIELRTATYEIKCPQQ